MKKKTRNFIARDLFSKKYKKRIVKPKKELNGLETSYLGLINNYKVRVVLSGFIGRIDNYARRRLGKEIEQYLNK